MIVGTCAGKRGGVAGRGAEHEMTPKSAAINILVNAQVASSSISDARSAATILGRKLIAYEVRWDNEIQPIFERITASDPASSVIVDASAAFLIHRERLVALIRQHSFPAIYAYREYVKVGGLISYGPRLPDVYHQAGVYVGRILKGDKPSELPIVQPTVFELFVNLKTAKALGLTIPETLLATADEVIQ
jgi:putative tryptophan/tyrosine transport system substrate-binding protein